MPIFSEPPAREPRYISVYERALKAGMRNVPLPECTETIGFESMSLNRADNYTDGLVIEGLDELDWSGPTETTSRRRKDRELMKRKSLVFPPVLTILNGGNGRPRFGFRRECTSDGRITMRMVASETRELSVKCFRGNGRLRMQLVGSDGEESD